jgi:CRISPR-associated protein Cas5d
MKNKLTFEVRGKYALFTDPLTRSGGEKFTYPIPTYQALKGITESIYWKPTIEWVVDKVRIMNLIRMESKGIRPIKYQEDKNDLAKYTYLSDVRYQVQVHFEWNLFREDLEHDRNENKHYFIAKRMIERGGRRDIFLGTRECQGYVLPCAFGEDMGAYDYGEMHFDRMFHGFNYPSETGNKTLEARFCQPIMKEGIIVFDRPEKVTEVRILKEMEKEELKTRGIENELLEGFDEEVIRHELDTSTQ